MLNYYYSFKNFISNILNLKKIDLFLFRKIQLEYYVFMLLSFKFSRLTALPGGYIKL